METPTHTPTILRAGDRIGSFTVTSVTPVPNLRLNAIQLQHAGSGARVIHLLADDAENLFCVCFPTPPSDDTGVPHILEHAVLSGSAKYPVRDPFFEMVKMSAATFINAMTGADATYYPVASNVRDDLFNLADVYFDAVFHPELSLDTFEREGHHLAPADPEDPSGALTTTGIVYNEMKSYYSQPEGVLYRIAGSALMPDGIYAFDSGGDPEAIPDLTHAGLRDYHRRLYHPSNGLFVLYGNIPTEDYVAFLEPRLDDFDPQPPVPLVSNPTLWDAPRRVDESYSVAAGDELQDKTFLQMEWLVGDGTDALEHIQLQLLGQVLAGNDASPLRKALTDASLGQDVMFCGASSVGSHITFSVTIRGSNPDSIDAFRALVLETLTRVADEGVDPIQVEAAFRRYAYECREVESGQPLQMAQRVLDAWLYEMDPLTFLHEAELLEQMRAAFESDPNLFSALIRDRLLGNTHRLDVSLRPDPEKQSRVDDAFDARMAARRSDIEDREAVAIAERAAELDVLAGTPNTAEQIATLPQLDLSQLPQQPVHIPTEETDCGGTTLLVNDVFSNGVNYFNLDVSLVGLPEELWPYLPRYIETVSKLGAAGLDYVRISERVASETGSFSCMPLLGIHATDPTASPWGLRFSFKALDEQVSGAFDVVGDILLKPDPRDPSRFKDVLGQTFSRMRSGLVNHGSGTACRYAARRLAADAAVGEWMSGRMQYARVAALLGDFDTEFNDEVAAQVDRIAAFVRNRGRWTASFTGTELGHSSATRELAAWGQTVGARSIEGGLPGPLAMDGPLREGLAASMQVAHCAQIIPAPHISHPDSPLLSVAMKLLSIDYMISELRFKGNAYGASCGYDGQCISLYTTADPNISSTLSVFNAMSDYIHQVSWGQDEVRRAVISAAKHAITPIRPEAATGRALTRHLCGQSTEVRERSYARLLGAEGQDIKRAILSVLEANQATAPVAVVSSREKLEQENALMPDTPLDIIDLLPEL